MHHSLKPEHRLEWRNGLPEIETERLLLRFLRPNEAGQILEYEVRNRERFEPWSPARVENYYGPSHWESFLDREIADGRARTAFRFWAFRKEDPADFIATVSLRHIQLGWFQNAEFGYSVDGRFERQGYMTEAATAVIRFAFEEIGLRRIQACCMPANTKSIGVLERLGFQLEGRLRSSLLVRGQWEDHLVFGAINENWEPK